MYDLKKGAWICFYANKSSRGEVMADRFAGLDYKGPRTKGKRYGSLFWNWNLGEGDATLSLDFEDMTEMAKLDFLADVIGVLKREYEAVKKSISVGVK